MNVKDKKKNILKACQDQDWDSVDEQLDRKPALAKAVLFFQEKQNTFPTTVLDRSLHKLDDDRFFGHLKDKEKAAAKKANGDKRATIASRCLAIAPETASIEGRFGKYPIHLALSLTTGISVTSIKPVIHVRIHSSRVCF